MKKYNKWIFNVASGLALTSVIATSCVDEIKFGNSFLEKAPGGSVTKDTVFNNAEYTRQFLTNLYGMQYYGLPYKNVANQESSNQYVGKPEALTDLYVFTYPSCGISGPYYKGTHTANYGKRSDKFDYLRNNVWEAVRGDLLYLLLMIINSSAMFVNVYAGVGMHLDNLQNASLANWCMVGYFIGALISIVLGSKGVHLKYLFALGFFFLALSAGFMYFEVQTAGLYERMKYPVIIRTIGMMILYALTAAYANQRMPFKYLSTWICIMLTVRMVLGPGIGGAIYSNVLQERQQHYITRYAQNVDLVNPEASASYTNTVQGMQYQGKSETEAHNMAAMSVKGRIQVQATLSAVKEMAGWTIYAGVICMIFVLVVPYPKRKLLT